MALDTSTKKEREAELIGIDAAPHIRRAQEELRAQWLEGKRRQEVDGDALPTRFKVDVLLIETPGGSWRAETMKDDIYQGQNGKIEVVERNERLALAEFRHLFGIRLVLDRFCNEFDSRQYAREAEISVVGRIPHSRIVSR